MKTTQNIFKSKLLADVCAFLTKADGRLWHEANGGNLSIRLTKEETRLLPEHGEGFALQNKFPSLDGECFIFTVSGSILGDIPKNPEDGMCIIRLTDGGTRGEMLYCPNGRKPTSEFACHLLLHGATKNNGGRVVYHCHPEALVAMTFVLPLTDRDITLALWRSISECALVLPDGIGVLEWMVPGSPQLASATAEKMKQYSLTLWAHHGVIAAGKSITDVFAAVDTAEKAARIYMSYHGKTLLSTITDEQLVAETERYGLKINRSLLDL